MLDDNKPVCELVGAAKRLADRSADFTAQRRQSFGRWRLTHRYHRKKIPLVPLGLDFDVHGVSRSDHLLQLRTNQFFGRSATVVALPLA